VKAPANKFILKPIIKAPVNWCNTWNRSTTYC